MAISKTDFSYLLPFFGTRFSKSFTAFQYTTPHFSDAILLFPLIANLRYQKKDGVKIVAGYGAGALLTIFFLAVFYALYASLAGREHYAFAKIGQYFPALSVVGRIDLLFVYFLSIVLLFYTCLPLQYVTHTLSALFNTERKTLISALLNFGLLVAILFLNRHYDGFYAVISHRLYPVFWILANFLPLTVLFLPKSPKNKQKIKNAPTMYALNKKNEDKKGE
jgi:hypothetical protein